MYPHLVLEMLVAEVRSDMLAEAADERVVATTVGRNWTWWKSIVTTLGPPPELSTPFNFSDKVVSQQPLLHSSRGDGLSCKFSVQPAFLNAGQLPLGSEDKHLPPG
jgi:hypothetical protein